MENTEFSVFFFVAVVVIIILENYCRARLSKFVINYNIIFRDLRTISILLGLPFRAGMLQWVFVSESKIIALYFCRPIDGAVFL